ncbi:MAG: transposase [Actinomycetota bacterium]|nr:transposase [Actinomycetota bacterium]
MPRTGPVTVIGDKGYAGRDFCAQAHDLGAVIVRPRRKDEPGRGPHLAPIRQRIESIFWTAKDMLNLEDHRARQLHTLRTRLAAKFLALTAAIALNRTPRTAPTQPHRLLRLTHSPWNDSSSSFRAARHVGPGQDEGGAEQRGDVDVLVVE